MIFGLLGMVPISLAEEGKWTKKAGMQNPRWGHSSSVVDGKIYIFGGVNGINCCPFSAIVEVYDSATDAWEKVTNLPTPRNAHSSSVVNGIIYTIGGWAGGPSGIVETYNPATNTWEEKAPMPTARTFFSTSVVNGVIYAIGGGSANAGDAKIYAAVEVYDPVTDTWTKETDLPTPRLALSTNVVDGKIYAIGGGPAVNVNYPKAIVEAFDTGFGLSSVNPAGKLSTTWGGIKAAR